ncbi:hypothetical protein IWQ56_002015 [Coemansia nantahalensis]|uniref:Uncharacterized protein n=2 Tax=Coemansia TaxID=4863 RepID=A0ACC1KVC1_9FUNG|nr:hypothetical protein IWQ57_006159 [Coemansia nantahalensis]KAJ2770840.1 hypothetical protein IWQ56_002015 [Coemansia nantahalensis]KAJ2795642.1 hypothetical protein H4R21_005030 [Coemansia helicoidea]
MVCVHLLAADTREFDSFSVDYSMLSRFTFETLAGMLSTLEESPARSAQCGDQRDSHAVQLCRTRFGTSLQAVYDQVGANDDVYVVFD